MQFFSLQSLSTPQSSPISWFLASLPEFPIWTPSSRILMLLRPSTQEICDQSSPHRDCWVPTARFLQLVNLLVAEGFNGIEARGAAGRVESRAQTDEQREGNRGGNQPHGHGPDVFGGNLLLAQIVVRAELNQAADAPSEDDSASATEQSHHSGFREK